MIHTMSLWRMNRERFGSRRGFAILASVVMLFSAILGGVTLAVTSTGTSASVAHASSAATTAALPTTEHYVPSIQPVIRAIEAVDPALTPIAKSLTPAQNHEAALLTQQALANNSTAKTELVHAALGLGGNKLWVYLGIIAAGAAAGFSCAFAFTGVGALGCVILISVVVSLAVYATLVYNSGPILGQTSLYPQAETHFDFAFSTLLNDFQTGTGSLLDATQTEMSLTNLTVGVWEYTAANAALSQLGNSTFNGPLDLQQAGIAQQIGSAIYAKEYEITDYIATQNEGLQGFFGPGAGYGGHGVVCNGSISAIYPAGLNASYGTYASDHSTLYSAMGSYGGTFQPDGECQENANYHTGWSGFGPGGTWNYYANYVPGTVLPTAAKDVAYEIGPKASLLVPNNGPANGNQIVVAVAPANNHADLRYFAQTMGASQKPKPITAPMGVYVLKGIYECTTSTSPASCSGAAAPNVTVLGTGFAPVNISSAPTTYDKELFDLSGLATAYNATNAGKSRGGIISFCSPADSPDSTSGTYQSFFSTVTTAHANWTISVPTCSGSVGSYLTDLNVLGNIATTVAKAYWNFLRSAPYDYTSAAQVPQTCVIPSPASFIPPNYNVASLEKLSYTEVEALLVIYIDTLAQSFSSSLTGSPSESLYCGHALPVIVVNLANVGILAIGDVYVPGGSQVFRTPSTWSIQNESMLIVPTAANLTIPVGKTWEAPSANPELLYYGSIYGPPQKNGKLYALNASSASKAEFNPTKLLPHLAGNSTKTAGSIYPLNTSSSFGAGDAIYLTACYQNVSGTWQLETSCDYTVEIAHYSISSESCLLFGQGCTTKTFPLPNTCTYPIITQIAGPISLIPFIGPFACAIAIFLLIIIVIVVIYAIYRIVKHEVG